MFCFIDYRAGARMHNRGACDVPGSTVGRNGRLPKPCGSPARPLFFAGIAKSLLILSILLLSSPRAAHGQDARANQRVVPVAEVYDLDFVAGFLEDQIIVPGNSDYTHAVFMDITEDGFGANDILVLYPDEEHFTLSPYLPDAMLNTLVALNLETDYRINTVRERSVVLASEAEGEEDPKKALAGAVLGSLLHYYPEGPMELHLVQRGEDVHITFWNYSEDLWTFKPDATQCIHPGIQEANPMTIIAHKQPEISSYLDSEGCVVVHDRTIGGNVVARTCP